jgi:hypothetical protein
MEKLEMFQIAYLYQKNEFPFLIHLQLIHVLNLNKFIDL